MPQLTTPPRTRPNARTLYDELRLRIIEGELPPGAALPSQRELCNHYEVGEGTAAAAMTRLMGEGLVVRKQRRGSFVAERLPAAAHRSRRQNH